MATSTTGDNAKIAAGNLFRVDGLIAVITGGGSGLGQMMARALALNGAKKVFIIGRRLESLQKTVESVSDAVPANTIVPLAGDVTSKESLSECFEKVKSQVSYIDALIVNHGISGPSLDFRNPNSSDPISIDKLAAAMWAPGFDDVTSTYAVNMTGVYFTIAAFLPLLGAANAQRPNPPTKDNFRPRPQIMVTGSIGGLTRRAQSNFSYGPSKAGVMHMTKQLATFLVPYDIRANVISPGLYLSEMTDGMMKSQSKQDSHNVEGTWERADVPATRTGDEQDMAGVVLFLCSRAGAYINGNMMISDGGRLSVLPGSY